MAKYEKVLRQVQSGTSDANVSFTDLCWLLERLGCLGRIRGSHHIYCHPILRETLNLQPGSAGRAKVYQVAQVRDALKTPLDERDEGA